MMIIQVAKHTNIHIIHIKMIETQNERELALILKCNYVKYNNESITGERAFYNLVACNLLNQEYTIDWDKLPVEIKIK